MNTKKLLVSLLAAIMMLALAACGDEPAPTRTPDPDPVDTPNEGGEDAQSVLTMYTFMDTESYEQMELNKEQLGDALNYLQENMEVSLQTFKERIIGISLPNSVNLKVTECEPSVKGNTATGATKMATLETGYAVRVPLFINEGDVLRIDTRTGNYIERA